MGRYATAQFTPTNPAKYLGPNLKNITYRSSWELQMMLVLDQEPAILGWSSESIAIPYKNPLQAMSSQSRRLPGGWSMYIPDFFVVYLDRSGTKHCEVIEVKPEKDMPGYVGRVNTQTKMAQAVNAAKWAAAVAYCAKRNWVFRIATEKQIFAFKRRK